MLKEKILLVDDDPDIHEIQRVYLEKEGYVLFFARDGKEAIRLAEKEQPDLIILDVQLPDMDGFEVCRSIRNFAKVPILFLSGVGDDVEMILGHRIGGDDYITKPFSPGLLVAKVKVHLRRYAEMSSKLGEQAKDIGSSTFSFGNIIVEKDNCVVKKNGKELSLSTKEFLLLCYLTENPNRVLSLEQIFERIWGKDSLGDFRTVMVHISNLRKKIEDDASKPQYLLTVRGLGYKFSR